MQTSSNPICLAVEILAARSHLFRVVFILISSTMQEVEEIVIAAKNVLPEYKFNNFVSEFRKLLKEPLVHEWHARSIGIFENAINCDDLTSRLFRFFQSREGCNWNINFLQSVYISFDAETYRRFFFKMVDFSVARYNRKERFTAVNSLLAIIEEKRKLHLMECQASGSVFPFRFYEKYRYFFEMYLALGPNRFTKLVNIMLEHRSRGSPCNHLEIQRLKCIAYEFFGLNKHLKLALLNYCMGDTVAPDVTYGQNPPVSNFRTSNDPTPGTSHTVRQVIQGTPNQPFINPNNPDQCTPTLGIPTTLTAGKNYPDIEFSTSYNPKPDSSTSIGHSVQGIQITENPTPVSAVPVRHNYPAQHASSVENLYGKHFSGWTPCCQFPGTPVAPRSLVDDPQTSNYSTRILSSFSVQDYDETTTNQQPTTQPTAIPEFFETIRPIIEAQNSVPAESFGTCGEIPEARIEHWSTQNFYHQPSFTSDPDVNDGTVPSPNEPDLTAFVETIPSIMEEPIFGCCGNFRYQRGDSRI